MVNNGATVTVANSTLAANSADMEGGGIMNWGTLTVTSSTLANNSAVQNGGGIYNTSYGTLTVANSVFGGNTAVWGPDVGNRGVIAAAQYNVIGNGANSGVAHGINGNQVGVNPRLDSAGLQDHGGPTQTIALLLDSPAIDAGDDDLALDPAGNPLTTDERGAGFPRMIGSAVDVGAWECPNVPPTVDAGGDQEVDEGTVWSLATSFTDMGPRGALRDDRLGRRLTRRGGRGDGIAGWSRRDGGRQPRVCR